MSQDIIAEEEDWFTNPQGVSKQREILKFKMINCPNCDNNPEYSGEGMSNLENITCAVEPTCIICNAFGRMIVCYNCNYVSKVLINIEHQVKCFNCKITLDGMTPFDIK
jgi:hypothetical protein